MCPWKLCQLRRRRPVCGGCSRHHQICTGPQHPVRGAQHRPRVRPELHERQIKVSALTPRSFFGRSTGAGAIAAWTHHLKDITRLSWSDEAYQGPALKLGAGVQGTDALSAAKKEGLVVVAGYCNSVGLAGGWIQGTGHSPLSTNFGLGADQTLEFDVVTAGGDIVKASRTENSDLYWALSGGGKRA